MKRIMMSMAVLMAAALTLPAQDWAKARMEKSSRHGEWVKVKQGKREVESYITYPEVKDKATAVVVIHEIFGLTDWARSVTDELAEAGYIAIAPDLLSGMGPNGGGTKELGQDVGRVITGLPPEQKTADLNAVVEYVKQLSACNGKVVVMGFCWGGGETFKFAEKNKDIKAALSFYGPQPQNKEDMTSIACPVYGFYGGNDARVSASVPKTTELMKEAGKTYEPVTYEGAGHGFMRGGEPANPTAREADKKAYDEAWKRVKEILKKVSSS